MSEQMTPGDASTRPSTTARPAMPLYRIVLLAVLGVALVLLVVDQTARFKARGAYDAIDGMLAEEDVGTQQDLSASAARTPSEIQKMLGRAPDDSQQRPEDLLETYGWRGVFNSYTVYVVYSGSTLAVDEGAASEPLLMKVGYNAEP